MLLKVGKEEHPGFIPPDVASSREVHRRVPLNLSESSAACLDSWRRDTWANHRLAS